MLVSHPRIGYVVAYGTAALIATVRGNDAWTRQYEQKALEGMDEIMGATGPGRTGPDAPRGPANSPAAIVTILFSIRRNYGCFRAIIDYNGGAGARNFTVFIQLTFSGSFTAGGDPST